MSTLMKILATLLLAVLLSAAPGIANARGGHGGGGHGGHGGHSGHGGHFHGGHFRGGFVGGWGWGYPYYYGGDYDPYYSDGCRWVRVRVWRGDHWRYRRVWRCWY